MNIKMLERLRVRGIYVVPGVPNSTEVTQEMDQLYGQFKSLCRSKLRTLVRHRHADKKTVTYSIDYFWRHRLCNVDAPDIFAESFSKERCKAGSEKIGAIPLTRKCLESDAVRSEVVVDAAGVVDVDADPNSTYI